MQTLCACPVCKSEKIRHDFDASTTRGMDEKVWSIHRCEACSHGFMNPQPSWDELEAYYSASYDPYDPSHGAAAQDDAVVEKAGRDGDSDTSESHQGFGFLMWVAAAATF